MLELIVADHRSGRVLATIAADRSLDRLRAAALRNLHLLQEPHEAFEVQDERREVLDWARLFHDRQGRAALLWGLPPSAAVA